MARAYSQDLRDRVIDAALAGAPARHVAMRFGIGETRPKRSLHPMSFVSART